MNPLQSRLASLRRRLRLVITFRGVCWLVTIVLLAAVVAGLLDWRLHLPGLVRAVLLAAALSGAGCVAYGFLLRPLRMRVDDLSLALRVEALHPSLNDSLASTVQFLEQPDDSDRSGSPSLRRAVVQQALRRVDDVDFRQVVTTRGVRVAGLSLAGSLALAALLIWQFPASAGTALLRLANPFGSRDWPRQTQLQLVDYRPRSALGEAYEIRCLVSGFIPQTGLVEFGGLNLGPQECQIVEGLLVARVDRLEHNFRFQVKVHDAESGWYEVKVLPPPVLVPLDGRSSPQVRLHYPAYTDLADQDLEDGSGNIDAVAGTSATLRAATDRPILQAWIEYRPEAPLVKEAAFLGLLGSKHPASLLALTACGQQIWEPVPVRLGATGRELTAQFVPCVTGTYALHFADEAGVPNTRLFNLHIFPDPPPVVNLERRSRSHDSLDLLPGADVHVQVSAEDQQYAVRTVFLEYHCKDEPARQVPLYDHRALGLAFPPLLSGLASVPMPALTSAGAPPLRLRPQRLQLAQVLSLQQVHHADGSGLREGDILILQASADDFDDVSVDKPSARSHEIELRIVGPAALETKLNRVQAQVQQELLRLRKMQQEALEHVIAAEQQWRNTGRLRPRDVDHLLQAEQLQQQIRARVGKPDEPRPSGSGGQQIRAPADKPPEGLRADVDRVLRSLRDNHLPRSGAQERMETVAAELERLTREELPLIEPRLTTARQENENAAATAQPSAERKGPLGEARQHQEEVENTLNELLKLLEPWGSINEVKGEARTILRDQRKLGETTRDLEKEVIGKGPETLTPEQKARLEEAAELQRKLEERTSQLLGKMERVGQERQEKDPDTAGALQEAARQGRAEGVTGRMKTAAEDIQKNQLGNADREQQESTKTLEQMVRKLEDRREAELDRLRKKLKDAQEKLADLAGRQEELRKKIKEAGDLTDPQAKERQLKVLARRQEELRKEAQEMLRELTRLRAEQAGQALNNAEASMEQAARQLERGQDPEDSQEETLDRLNEAQRRLQQTRREVEDELAREKLAKVADQIKLFKERQDAANARFDELQKEVARKMAWDRVKRNELSNQADAQKGLGQETKDVAEDKLAGAKVFARLVTRAAEAMDQAAVRMQEHAAKSVENPETPADNPEVRRLQAEASRRLGQLLDALKPEQGQAQRQGGNPAAGGASKGGPGDGIPPLAEFKALRALQQEVNEDTERFGKRHPDLGKLTEPEAKELQALRDKQQEVADLLDELTAPAAGEGENK